MSTSPWNEYVSSMTLWLHIVDVIIWQCNHASRHVCMCKLVHARTHTCKSTRTPRCIACPLIACRADSSDQSMQPRKLELCVFELSQFAGHVSARSPKL